MYQLNLPTYQLKLKQEKGKTYVFDLSRKKFIVLTPEEYVRQQFLQFLFHEKNYPKGLTATEASLRINKLKKRADIVLFDTNGKAKLIVECKAPEVKITQKTFDQIVRYNMEFKADYLIVTNGLSHYCAKISYADNSFVYLKDIPHFSDL